MAANKSVLAVEAGVYAVVTEASKGAHRAGDEKRILQRQTFKSKMKIFPRNKYLQSDQLET